MKITRLLTDNGKEFTDRLFTSRERKPSGNHAFDVLCQDLGIAHRLAQLRSPQTNGMVERFNSRIGDALQTHRFNCALDMNQALLHFMEFYNHRIPQSAQQSRTPIQAVNQWYEFPQELFNKRPYNRRGCDT